MAKTSDPNFTDSFQHHGQRPFKVPSKATFAKLKSKQPAAAAMSTSEIQSWISSAGAGENGEESTDQVFRQRDRVMSDWPGFIEYAQTKLLVGKTKSRIQFLREELLTLGRNGGKFAQVITSHRLDLASNRLGFNANFGSIQAIDADVPSIYGFWLSRCGGGGWDGASAA